MNRPDPAIRDEMLSALLDGEIDGSSLGRALRGLREDADARETVTVFQLIKDAVAGVRTLDDGYSLRILDRIDRHRGAGADSGADGSR